MQIIVSKFGGSSTATADMFKKLGDILSGHPERRYIILSAPGTGPGLSDKITNLLYQCYDLKAAGKCFTGPLDRIVERFASIAEGLGLPDPSDLVRKEVLAALSVSRDHTASRGEYLCTFLFSRWSGIPMADACDLIHFYEDGRLNVEKTNCAIRKMKERSFHAVIPGFYGSMPDGRIHTFPRNGSDITGALISAGVEADLYENWSDVDGFMTADPSIVADARFNPHLNYRQMYALSSQGARILHPDCLEPVSSRSIPTLLKNTNDPEGPGTLISDDFGNIVPCVTGMFCRYLPVDDPRAANVPEGMSFRCLTDISGNECMILGESDAYIPSVFFPAACVSVFGLPENRKHALLEKLKPAHCFEKPDHLMLIVPPEAYHTALRTSHNVLTGKS